MKIESLGRELLAVTHQLSNCKKDYEQIIFDMNNQIKEVNEQKNIYIQKVTHV